ncbi:MAG: D-ribose transporter subunit RbsB [Solirubrobacterales bacterium]|jgi:ribose transport system substrate-binding protein|nr:D-ribose transporter subunit RbsB [Solirubrobacterales bacterium]
MRHVMSTAVAVLGLGLLAAGCGGASESSSGGSASAAKSSYKIGITVPSFTFPYFLSYKEGAEAEAKKLGVKILWADGRNDPSAQGPQIETFLVQGVQGIVVVPNDISATIGAVKRAEGKDVPVITSNRALKTAYSGKKPQNPIVHTGYSDPDMGVLQGELVVKACAQKVGAGKPCTVVNEKGQAGSSSTQFRDEGMAKVFAQHPEIKVIDEAYNGYDPAKALQVTQNLLSAHPKFDVLTAPDDNAMTGELKAVEKAGRLDSLRIVSLGGTKQGLSLVEQGKVFGTIWLPPKDDGALAVRTIVDVLKGNQLDTTDVDGIPYVKLPIAGVTKDELSKYPPQW